MEAEVGTSCERVLPPEEAKDHQQPRDAVADAAAHLEGRDAGCHC